MELTKIEIRNKESLSKGKRIIRMIGALLGSLTIGILLTWILIVYIKVPFNPIISSIAIALIIFLFAWWNRKK